MRICAEAASRRAFSTKHPSRMAAAQPQARVGLRADLGPRFLGRVEGEIGPAARLRGARPFADGKQVGIPLFEEAHLFQRLVQPVHGRGSCPFP